jgi:hypothetical protein
MADVAYKEYFIISVPEFDTLTLTWTPRVTVSWKVNGHREQVTLSQLPNLFPGAKTAEDCGVNEAKAWVDQRL